MKPAHHRIAFDWEEVHRRLARVKAATESTLQLSPKRAREIMDERARALACVPDATPDAADVMEVVAFRRGPENYALESRYVHEVIAARELTPVPGTPGFVLGIANLHGEVLVVFDLCMFLGISQPAGGDFAQILVIGDKRPEFGVPADNVDEVLSLRVRDLRELPTAIAAAGRDYFRGVTRHGLVVLAGEVLLHDQRLIIDEDGKDMLCSPEETS